MSESAAWLAKALDYEFDDAELLQRALTHRSASGGNNERLEFLGDAILDAVVSEMVFELQPDADEGDLSRLRASLVKDVTLAEIAGELGIGDHLTLGVGERRSGGHRRASILADAFEAIIGAIYLDSGYDAVQKVVRKAYASRLESLPDAAQLRDPKTRLQELLQSRRIELPEYTVISVTGKAHRQTFTVACSVPSLGLSTEGSGSSRRSAEQLAADLMLDEIAGTD